MLFTAELRLLDKVEILLLVVERLVLLPAVTVERLLLSEVDRLYNWLPLTASVELLLTVPFATLVIFWAVPEPWLAS